MLAEIDGQFSFIVALKDVYFLSLTDQNNILQVYDVASSGGADVDYTPSNVVLQGRWAIVNNFGDAPDWSVK